ncbi:MAG: dihydrofolate reductase family protein [Thermoleophilaceae bacterium]|nr:dihydrofolate reductase family protein [Thermoleophilaceae bacterium]
MFPVQLKRIHPEPGSLTPVEAMSGLKLGDLAPPERPYVVANMVATVDGRAAIDGKAGPIGDEADRELFQELRTQVDAVLVGAGTVRAENYGRLVKDPERRARRERAGLAPDPLALIASHTGRAEIRDQESIVLEPNPDTLRELREQRGIRSILCEGGPTLNGSMLEAGLVDELFLSLAPKLAGGGVEPGIVRGPGLPKALDLALVSVYEHESCLFLRYRISGSGS